MQYATLRSARVEVEHEVEGTASHEIRRHGDLAGKVSCNVAQAYCTCNEN
jgi:hypothetical protein